MLDGLQEILFTLRQNKLRTVLTAFGVFWGIFMLVLLLGAGRGMQNGIYDDFGSDVRDWMIVWSATTLTTCPVERSSTSNGVLGEADACALKSS